MDNGLTKNELTSLASTYSILTADRILERFGLRLPHDVVAKVIDNPDSVYFAILLVPYNNVINGIIHQQAYDYQVYAQKLFVDYLISGSGNENPEGQGAGVRDSLDACRVKLMQMGESFDKETLAHKQLILESQAFLKNLLSKSLPIEDSEQLAQSVQQAMLPFYERVKIMNKILGTFRIDFKALIIEVISLIQLLPGYKPNDELDEKNRISLQFDDHIGIYE